MAILCWCFVTGDVDSAGDGDAVITVNVEVDMRAVDQTCYQRVSNMSYALANQASKINSLLGFPIRLLQNAEKDLSIFKLVVCLCAFEDHHYKSHPHHFNLIRNVLVAYSDPCV